MTHWKTWNENSEVNDTNEREDANDTIEPEKITRSEGCWEDQNDMKIMNLFRRRGMLY